MSAAIFRIMLLGLLRDRGALAISFLVRPVICKHCITYFKSLQIQQRLLVIIVVISLHVS